MADALRPPPAWFRAARALVRRLPAGRFRAFERLSRISLAPFEDRLHAEIGGARYGCDLRNVIAREACLTGRTAPAETAAVRASLPPGGMFVDVGPTGGTSPWSPRTRWGPPDAWSRWSRTRACTRSWRPTRRGTESAT